MPAGRAWATFHPVTDIVSDSITLVAFQIRDGRPWFLLLRRDTAGAPPEEWEVVTGRRRAEESPPRAAIRRLLEWTALDPNALWALDHLSGGYDVERDVIAVTPCFAAQVSGSVELSDRHDASRWLSVREAANTCSSHAARAVIELANAQCALPLAAGAGPSPRTRIV